MYICTTNIHKTMKVYTSYFGNLRTLGKHNIMPISIARYSPRWYTGARYVEVSPTSYMLSGACSHKEYLQKYEEILNRLSAAHVMEVVASLSKGRDIALCCYEKPGEFCHRHLLSEWLRKNGFDVKEWEREEKKEEIQQLSLFD